MYLVVAAIIVAGGEIVIACCCYYSYFGVLTKYEGSERVSFSVFEQSSHLKGFAIVCWDFSVKKRVKIYDNISIVVESGSVHCSTMGR